MKLLPISYKKYFVIKIFDIDNSFFTFYLKAPVFVIKREVLYMPIFGLYIFFSKMILIDRKRKITSIKKIINHVKNRTDDTGGNGPSLHVDRRNEAPF